MKQLVSKASGILRSGASVYGVIETKASDTTGLCPRALDLPWSYIKFERKYHGQPPGPESKPSNTHESDRYSVFKRVCLSVDQSYVTYLVSLRRMRWLAPLTVTPSLSRG